MSNLVFHDRVAVITGAGRGLGRAYALLLGSRGAKVVVNDPGGAMSGEGSDAGPANDVVREIVAAGGKAVASTASVATPEGGAAIVQTAVDAFGAIDILIHNAGNRRVGSLKTATFADFEALLDVHLRGAFHVVRAAFPLMCAAGYGRIVLTSSLDGIYGNRDVAAYGLAKAGMIGLCNVAAIEGADDGVKCNIVIPNAVTRMAEGVDTSKFPPMTPELVAPVVGWLAHESCSVSGEMLTSMAGRIARAFVGETKGAYRASWTIEAMDAEIETIRDLSGLSVPGLHGHADHMRRTFAMVGQAREVDGDG